MFSRKFKTTVYTIWDKSFSERIEFDWRKAALLDSRLKKHVLESIYRYRTTDKQW